MPDWVQIFFSAPPAISPAVMVKVFKGENARKLFTAFSHLKGKLGRTGAYGTGPITSGPAGHVSAETIRGSMAMPTIKARIHAGPGVDAVIRDGMFFITKVYNGILGHIRIRHRHGVEYGRVHQGRCRENRHRRPYRHPRMIDYGVPMNRRLHAWP